MTIHLIMTSRYSSQEARRYCSILEGAMQNVDFLQPLSAKGDSWGSW